MELKRRTMKEGRIRNPRSSQGHFFPGNSLDNFKY
jgi:hypothetical protein